MKRLMMMAMALLLCMALSASLADNATIFKQEDNSGWNYVNDMAVVGDRIWLLMSGETGFWLNYWEPGMETAQRVEGSILHVGGGDDAESLAYMAEETGLDAHYAMSFLFTDGQRLMTVNPVDGNVFAVEMNNGALTYTDVVTMVDTKALMHVSDGWSYLATINGAAAAGDEIFFLVEDWDEFNGEDNSKLVRLSLKDGSVKTEKAEGYTSMCAFKDGQLLIAAREGDAWDYETGGYIPASIIAYNPATGAKTVIGEGPRSYRVRLAYCQPYDAVIYVNGGRTMALYMDGTSRQVGYMPMRDVDRVAVLGTSAVAGSYESYMVRDMDPQFATDEQLVLYSYYNTTARSAFGEKYPNIPVYDCVTDYYDGNDKLLAAMQNGDMDILSISCSYGPYQTLRDRGYCADLSASSALTTAVSRMYPVFADALKDKNGRVVGIPASAWGYAWMAERNLMKEMDIAEEDIPTSYPALVDFLNSWNANYDADFPEYTAMEMYYESARDMLFNMLMDDYLNWCQAQGGTVKFDTPEFREAAGALERLNWEPKMNETTGDGEEWTWYEPLMNQGGNSTVGNFQPNDEYSYNFYVRITDSCKPVQPVELNVLIINPWSKHQEAARAFLETVLDTLSDEMKYTIFADLTEPVLNPEYDQMVANAQRWVEEAKKNLEEAATDEERESWQVILADEERYLANMDTYRYSISEEGIANYKNNVVPLMFISYPTFFTSQTAEDATQELSTLQRRFIDRQISLDEFIRSSDQKLWMMQMENQ